MKKSKNPAPKKVVLPAWMKDHAEHHADGISRDRKSKAWQDAFQDFLMQGYQHSLVSHQANPVKKKNAAAVVNEATIALEEEVLPSGTKLVTHYKMKSGGSTYYYYVSHFMLPGQTKYSKSVNSMEFKTLTEAKMDRAKRSKVLRMMDPGVVTKKENPTPPSINAAFDVFRDFYGYDAKIAGSKGVAEMMAKSMLGIKIDDPVTRVDVIQRFKGAVTVLSNTYAHYNASGKLSIYSRNGGKSDVAYSQGMNEQEKMSVEISRIQRVSVAAYILAVLATLFEKGGEDFGRLVANVTKGMPLQELAAHRPRETIAQAFRAVILRRIKRGDLLLEVQEEALKILQGGKTPAVEGE